ncbi:TetM/TetW/TetO/TetS family tetracycline resistance ribosomal protection protein [Bacillus salipaludis]|uniref:TetM/TetW/TetO/TetS family tetracycline resistance ribosomal protection protein n=1 Tax=Bacillus salipaludis TaxID=2547811 RepID=A0A4R5VM17_9BACI|nr:TetM/TetW/TetO/TetS family tetracycline resistance ribosomal protection protein [Bacillus salipaludis]MDQ6596099.1 TetM/TetW/TetO/TetS family tetracycline resistance ribosomal protection protein [Bacillus salipaludis]TDK59130.1 TetM/TetW/TetO/TetS family tetracycline resistance ribosomal protection protein [Bacillus salipaludis]
MNKTIGILAHVDAGKTTFSEQLLFHTKSIKKLGRVDHQDAFLDSHEIEKQRGITVFADQGMFEYGNSTYYLIDTPGHVDFSPEMERAIQVMDFAIILISAVEGIEGHTETVWNLLKKHHVPTFFFINKIDRTGANVEEVLEEIRSNFTKDLCDISASLSDRTMSEELMEFIAERDEEVFEYYMENGYEPELWLEKMQSMIQAAEIYPCASGSALQDIGVKNFLEKFDLLTVTDFDSNAPFAGRVYKIRYDETGTRVTFIKALSGTLKVRDGIACGNGGMEKVTQIRMYNGSQYRQIDQVSAGELFAVTGITNASVGDGVGALEEKAVYDMVPTLKSKVVFDPGVNPKEALKYFLMLDSEDPSLYVIWEERLQEIHLHVMGAIQLEVLEQIIFERFHLKIAFEQPEILYKETIDNEVIGYGHFEPLKHYAEVHLKIEPGKRNSGILYESSCHTDDLSIGLQNLVGQHLVEREHHGLLTGSPITDLKVTLLTGRAHNKHTHGGDFREAVFRALRQGLEKANNILLEPFYHFKIIVTSNQMGRVLSDVQAAHGRIDSPMTDGDKAILTGIVPVATFMNYSMELASFTQGKGRMSLTFAGYHLCHNAEEVIEHIGYDKNADPDYTSSSIFCSKGQGFTVKWDEAEGMMHCL